MIPIHLGDFPAGASVFVPFATFNAAGASISLVDFVLADIRIYKDGGVTQRTSLNGIALLDTDGIDFDGVVGLNGFSIDLSDNSDAGFYELGSEYWVVVTPVTIDSQAVSFFAATFSMGRIANVVWDERLTGATHNVTTSAGRRLRSLVDFGAYEDGAVWLDTVDGTDGTTDFENGTVNNPVKTIADALTIRASIGLPAIHVLPGSSVTLAASIAGIRLEGEKWTLAFNGQNVGNCLITGATISGTFLGTPRLDACTIGNITGPSADLHDCGFLGTITADAAGDWFIHHGFGKAANTAISLTFDFGAAVGNTALNIRACSMGIELLNMGRSGTDTATLEGWGQVVFNANCTGGSVSRRGHWQVTDNAGGVVTETLDDTTSNVAAIKDKTDDLTFTKAKELDSNVQSLNGTTLAGDGSATPWGP